MKRINDNFKRIIVFFIVFFLLYIFFSGATIRKRIDITLLEYKGEEIDSFQFFYDTGDGFSEKKSIRLYKKDGNYISKTADIFKNIKNFRIDINYKNSDEQKISFERIRVRVGRILSTNIDASFLNDDRVFKNDIIEVEGENNTFLITGEDPYIVLPEEQLGLLKLFRLYSLLEVLIYIQLYLFFCLNFDRIKKSFLNLYFKLSQRLYGYKDTKSFQVILILVLFGFFVLILYRKYIFGGFIYCMRDDSFNQVYAFNCSLAREIAQHRIPLYTFTFGLGSQNRETYYNIFSLIAASFGINNVASGMIFAQCLKVFLGLIFSYLYFRKLNYTNMVSVIGAFCFMSAGTSIALGMYNSYTMTATFVALLLYFFEVAIKNGKWIILSLPMFMIFLNLGYYYGFLWIFVLQGYAFVRFYMCGFKGKEILKRYIWLLVSVFAALVLYSPILYGNLKVLFNSDRFIALTSSGKSDIVPIVRTVEEFKVAILRLFSPDMMGEYNDAYRGYSNYMNDSILYSGILVLLVIPISFRMYKHKREKYAFIFLLILSLLYICIPSITFLSNAGASYSYKMSGFVINVILIFIGCHGLNSLYDFKGNKDLFNLIASSWIYILLYFIIFESSVLDKEIAIYAIMYCIIYTVIINVCISDILLNKRIFSILLIFLCFSETLVMTNSNVNNSRVISKKAEKESYYNDETLKALAWIKENETEPFYRIEKNYMSASYNDSVVQNYHGVKLYVGGANQSNYMADFYRTLDMPLSNNNARWLMGFEGYPELNSFVGVKYMITNKKPNSEYGYTFLKEINGYKIYRNNNALPLGFMTHSLMSEEKFKECSVQDKRFKLFDTCIISDKSLKNDLKESYVSEKFSSKPISTQVEVIDSGSGVNEFELNGFGGLKIVKMKIKCNEREKEYSDEMEGTMAHLYMIDSVTGATVANRPISIEEGEKEYIIEFYGCYADKLKINFEKIDIIDSAHIEIMDYNANYYYKELNDKIEDCQNESLNIKIFNEDYIDGDITVEERGYLVLTIPYDDGWRCFVNGREQEIERVDIAFSGIFLEAGDYHITLDYKDDARRIRYFYVAILLTTAIALMIYLYMKRNRHKKCI